MKVFARQILCFLLLWQSVDLYAQSPAQTAIEKFAADASMESGSVSFHAIRVKDKSVVASYHPKRSLVPASVMKVVTTGAALMVLKPNHRFTTSLVAEGEVDTVHGIIHGNLAIIGGGDPTLGSPLFYKDPDCFITEFAGVIQSLGIKEIRGRVVGDDHIFPAEVPPTWAWGDIGNYYGAWASGLSVFDNTYKISFSTGAPGEAAKITGMDASVEGMSISSAVESSASSRDNAYIFGAPYSWERVVRGTIPANRKDFVVKGAIPDPAYTVAMLLHKALIRAGVRIAGEPVSRHQMVVCPIEVKLHEFNSPQLSAIIKETNMHSLNPYAEALLSHTGMALGRSADLVSATEAMEAFWKGKGVNTSGMFLNDGSGLSRANGLSAAHLTDILHVMANQKIFGDLLLSLPVGGRSGSLSSILKGTPAENNLRAKSGYMTRVRSYAGYVKNKVGEDICFAIIVNNYTNSPSEIRNKMAAVMAALAY